MFLAWVTVTKTLSICLFYNLCWWCSFLDLLLKRSNYLAAPSKWTTELKMSNLKWILFNPRIWEHPLRISWEWYSFQNGPDADAFLWLLFNIFEQIGIWKPIIALKTQFFFGWWFVMSLKAPITHSSMLRGQDMSLRSETSARMIFYWWNGYSEIFQW